MINAAKPDRDSDRGGGLIGRAEEKSGCYYASSNSFLLLLQNGSSFVAGFVDIKVAVAMSGVRLGA